MADIAYNFFEVDKIDVVPKNADLKTGEDLYTAVIISVFSDRRAEPDDITPGDDRRGYWGDTIALVEGHKLGSRLWLLAREKQTNETLNRAREYVQECLEWLVDDGVASRVTVENEWIRLGLMGIKVKIDRPDGTTETYDFIWNQISAL